MQSFFATLAQVSATLLGIFGAATIAYLVFLNEQVTRFSEQIESIKVEIGSELSRMNTAWPQSLQFFVPPLFQEIYRQRHTDKSGTALISQLCQDLIFHSDELINTVREASGSHVAEGRWEGRLYTFILTEIVRAVGGGAPGFHPTIFPASPGGLGFDQWREHFKEMQGSVDLLRTFRSGMISNFELYIREQRELCT